ncbi:MFS transporter [Streptomyces drozdowiczii]|uniref:MFS transporter n=1 Tax=Streptomyces drozdowiczii TaxID=202862 RepID=A0ABY6PSI6_9ACTN|nr:MFS transporter [Streptomyces drozdowiczii]MCX0245290.1 MFS transporter [Streptomyces drozdowiczii]UZK55047.1 MFS transporter [Streptomyces drozdowiczii]
MRSVTRRAPLEVVAVSRTETAAPHSRWRALAVLCAGQLMVILDGTVVNVALPAVQRDLGFSPSALAWVVNIYLVPFGGLLLLSGRLGDLVGRKRVFVAGLALFTAASLLCGLAQDPATLLASRFVQGVGGAVTSAGTLGMVVTLFPEARERAKAIGVYSFVQSAGGSLGLLAGGVLTQALSWHWIFVINVPIGAVAVLAAGRVLAPERGSGLGRGADAAGALLVTSALMLGVYTIVGTAAHGWASAHTLGLGAAALALLLGFVVRQARAAHPLLPLRVFRSRVVAGAMGIQALMVAGMFSFQFLCVLYVQKVLGYDEIRTGLGLSPVSVAIGALSLGLAPSLIARFGPRTVLLPGLALIAAGLAVLGRVPADGSYAADVLPALLPLGIGFGLAMPSLATLAMSGATPEDSGIASGMFNTMQQIGSAFGLAVLSTLATSHTEALTGDGAPPASALTSGYQLAFRVGAGLVTVALVLAATLLRNAAAPRAASREAESVSVPEVKAPRQPAR